MTKKPAKRRSKAKAEVVEDVLETPSENIELDTEAAEDVAIDDAEVVTDVVEDAPIEEPAEESIPALAEPTPEPAKGASPMLMLLGGLVAGGIGYGISTFQGGFDDSGLNTTLTKQADQIEQLQAQIADLSSPVDISGLEGNVAKLGEGLAEVDENIAGLSDRIEVVEKQPSADGTLQEAAVAAYQRDIDALRTQIEAQQAEMSEMMAATTAQLAQTREEAVAIEETAVAKARQATARVALSKVDSAIDSGVSFSTPLAELTEALGISAPTALVDTADGVATLSDLQQAFPLAAREALSVARSEGASGEAESGLGSFLRSQLNVRSVAPQEGDSVDAILSRAEAALKDGRLADTMAEVAGLPEVARATLTDWSAMAETRFAAQEAVAELVTQIDAN